MPETDDLLDWTICDYCGVTADTVDHAVPQALIDAIRDSGDAVLEAGLRDRRRRMTVPACRECNSLAGAVYDHTLADRRHRIAERFARRHKRELAMPDWSARELHEMGLEMRDAIIRAMVHRDELKARMARLRR